MFKRVLNTIAALGIGQTLHVLSQLTVPPVFIAVYGIDAFALWLLLTAATSHLNTLDFGLQTYLVNELTLIHHRGEEKRFHEIQSTGIYLALGLVMIGLLAATVLAVFPVGKWLGIPDTSDARLTLGFLSLQVLGMVLFGQFIGLYRVIGQPQRGVQWHNGQRALTLIGTVGMAALHSPFWAIAAMQFGCTAAVLLVALDRMRRSLRDVFPRLGCWNPSDARRILGRSAFFGLFSLNQLLVFQIPVLLLSRFASPGAVVAYSVGRTLFSFVRQLSNLLMAALAPELTRLMGSRDRTKLARTYRSVESVVCATALAGCVGVFLISPLALTCWLNKPELFAHSLFLQLMLASLAMLVKESKLYFQHATNEHIPTAVMTSITYALMLVASVPAMMFAGASGFLVAWLLAEVVQIVYLQRFNARLLGEDGQLSSATLWKLGITALCAAILLDRGGGFVQDGSLPLRIIKTAALLAGVATGSFYLFDLAPLARHSWSRWRKERSDEALIPRLLTL